MWLYFVGRGVVLVFLGGELVMGAFNHVLENLTLWCVVVGGKGWVSMCVFSVLFKIFCRSCGVCKFIVGCDWLCTQIIDVRVGFVYW